MSAPAKSDGDAVALAETAADNKAQLSGDDAAQLTPSVIGSDPDTHSVWRTIKDNPIVILCCFYANLGAFMYGFDNITLSLSLDMPAFVYVDAFNTVQPTMTTN
jgi:hypothetical protein